MWMSKVHHVAHWHMKFFPDYNNNIIQTNTKSIYLRNMFSWAALKIQATQKMAWISIFLSCMFLLTCLLVFNDLCSWVWVQNSSISNQYQRLLLFWYSVLIIKKMNLAQLTYMCCIVNWCLVPLQRCTDGDDGASPSSSCSVAVATHRERRLPCNRMERKMEENTVRDVETGV